MVSVQSGFQTKDPTLIPHRAHLSQPEWLGRGFMKQVELCPCLHVRGCLRASGRVCLHVSAWVSLCTTCVCI